MHVAVRYGTARERKARRQAEAKVRQERYDSLSMHAKIEDQIRYRGKQFYKLAKRVEKDKDGCYTMPDGECISTGGCMHYQKVK